MTAVQVGLDFNGFVYRKWGSDQRCKPGDWLVNNKGDIYTIDNEVFQRTHRKVSPGVYVKTTPIWAEIATEAGVAKTKEGKSHYEVGDYLVSNSEDGTDAYCITAAKFESMYELDD